MAQASGAIVINMGNTPEPKDKEKKNNDPLFGPNIGVVTTGPAWTTVNEKKVLTDELTQDVVQHWIEKSKETSQPTTTLQALVNLKRPTLRLSPLESDDSSHHHHGLEFEYDCDAPKCGIYVHVLLPTDHPDAGPSSSTSNGLSKLLVFESVVDGGFGRVLKLDEGATLELGRFENVPKDPLASTTSVHATADAAATNSDSPQQDAPPTSRRRRFTHFTFKKRPTGQQAVAGPALAVVDAQPATGAKTDSSEDPDKEGVRVTIRLAALDEHGTELASPNEQITYLHVIRFGAKQTEEGDAEDTRPWVVKVVKREATIGPHTFHLHEIYGLSASSTSQPVPTAPLPSNESHTYPPVTPATAGAPLLTTSNGPVTPAPADDSEPSSECLVCLSSPREVVLLPCRHLVACKDCALNMIEFGAGGAITQPTESDANATPGDGEGNAAPTVEGGTAIPTGGEANAPPAVTPTPGPGPNGVRRKRKAKGWFCPVCRQPYTSLLRITTTPPPPPSEDAATKTEQSGEAATTTNNNTNGNASDPLAANREEPSTTSRIAGLIPIPRPAFLRGLSGRNTDPERQ